jgi:SAM-dependent methyltransferase
MDELQAEVMRHYGVGPRYADAYLRYWESARGRTERTLAEILARPQPEPMWFDFALSANWRGERLAERLRTILPQGARRYLDVGCGFGGFLVAFARLGLDVCGIELDPVRVELSRANLADEGLGERVHARSILEPDLASSLGTFDVITCIDVIEHVDDVPTAIVRMGELLRPGGILVLEIPNAEAVSFVGRDGHFGLFGITLLDREDALEYHRRFFADVYDVGEYHPLGYYEARFAALGCSSRLLDAHGPTEILRPLLAGTSRYLRETRTALPGRLRSLVDRRFAAYLARMGASYASQLLGDRFKQTFRRRFAPEFWTLLVAKPS